MNWFLLRELVLRDVASRYKGSLLGFGWAFASPAFLLSLYYIVFSILLETHPTNSHTDNFGLFLFAGLLPWMGIQEGVARGTTAIRDNAVLVKSLRISPDIFVLAVVLSALLHEGIAALLFLGVILAMGEGEPLNLVWLLVALPLQLGLTCGLGLCLSLLNVLFRDISQLIGMLLMGWFFFTPIVYSLSQVEDPLVRQILRANPLTGLVELYRLSFLGGQGPSASSWLVLWAAGLALPAGGYLLLACLKPTLTDEL